MTPTRAGAAKAVAAIVPLVAIGAVVALHQPSDQTTRISRPEWSPAGKRCYHATARLDPSALALLGVDAGSFQYRRVKFCAQPVDGGVVAAPPGMVLVEPTVTDEVDAIEGDSEISVSDDGTGFPCACSTGSDCTVQGDAGTEAAPLGVTLPPGTFSGSGCRSKPCVILAGYEQWPGVCPMEAP